MTLTGKDIKNMFEKVSNETREVIIRPIKDEFKFAIESINKYLQENNLTKGDICPNVCDIFNAFKLCDINDTKIVLVGQDPYSNEHAHGLSFSSLGCRKTPPSLKNIFECLQKSFDYTTEQFESNDLTLWAQQGILLINMALTTVKGKSNAHAKFWKPYTNKLIQRISSYHNKKIIFILLGRKAQELKPLIDNKHLILEWGHPSPLSTANKDKKNPRHFINCDVFKKANEELKKQNDIINWTTTPLNDSLSEQTQTINIVLPTKFIADKEIYLFTDGGSLRNGKANCVASWGYLLADNKHNNKYDHGKVYNGKIRASNNRGELSAILFGLKRFNNEKYNAEKLSIISDSQYCINSITKWAPKWFKDINKHKDKKNLDLFKDIIDEIKKIRANKIQIAFRHVNSHRKEPPRNNFAHLLWKGNMIVDKFCANELV